MSRAFNDEQERLLLEQTRSDPEAFRELYQHYFPRIYAYVAYRVGRVWDTEDVVAEVFLKVVTSLRSFEYRGAGSFAAWIFSIARSQVSQFYRQQGKAEHIPLDDLPEIRSDALSPDHILMQKERFARLHALIGTLSGRRQEIITLRFFGGLRNQEIAAVLGLDERTIASHLCRAIEDLERKYQDESEVESSHEPE